ncbi:MAG: hypothetical protein IPK60_08590 [Sandaracinaceae bacterium]|nr:hypothetical protein [Sandaracinaceae bacterium]
MRTRHSVAILTCLMSACAANVDVSDKADPEALVFAEADEAADGFTRRLQLRGEVEFSVPVEAAYAADGSYAGYLFTAGAGTDLTINVQGHRNDPVVYLYGPARSESWSRHTAIAVNDDGGPGLDSLITRRIRTAGTYLIIVREYAGRAGDFTLSLDCDGVQCHPACSSEDMCGPQSHCRYLRCALPCESHCVPTLPETCDVELCGPPLRAPLIMCEDGSLGGNTGRCLREDGASCGWELRECPAPVACGARLGNTCAEGQFCKFEEAAICGFADATGTCAAIPSDGCTKELSWVCGCDGVSYQNGCMANAAGTSVQHAGQCEPAPVACGGRLRATCGRGEFCDFDEAAMCGFADASGTCAQIPEICTRELHYVCGCDGVTYQNGCMANAAGTSILHDDRC